MTLALTNIKYDHIARVTTLFNVFFLPILENNQWSYSVLLTNNNDATFHLKLDDDIATTGMIEAFLNELTQTLRK